MGNTVEENKYISCMFRQMPTEQKTKNVRTIKKNDCLWNIAKEATGSKKNGEIQAYMMRIAKMNGLDTVEKMNSLNGLSEIYMPDIEKKATQATNPVKPTTPVSKPDKTKPVQNKPEQRKYNETEQVIFDRINNALNSEKMSIDKGSPGEIYHFKVPSEEFFFKVTAFSTNFNQNRKLKDISLSFYNGRTVDRYSVTPDGTIMPRTYCFADFPNAKPVGKLNKEDMANIIEKINEKLKNYK